MGKQRVVYFDVLNILAMLCVVFLHTNGMVHSFQNTMAWRQALVVEVVCYWAVPIFFMLSGANLMNYRQRYTTAEFFKKRLIRILVPFVIWTFVYAILFKINPLEIGFREFFNRCFNTQIMTNFWFFIPMFAVYFAMPVISLLKDHRKILWYMVGLSFVLSAFMPQIFVYLKLTWNYSLASVTCGGFLMYTILGYLLATTEFTMPKRIIIYALGLAAIALRYFVTLFLSVRDGAVSYLFFDYLQYHTVFLAVAVFVFFKNSKVVQKLSDKPKLTNLLKNVSGLSFGIYLVHQAVMFVLQNHIDPTTYTWRLAVPLLVYAISAVIVFALKKIPILKYIVP